MNIKRIFGTAVIRKYNCQC